MTKAPSYPVQAAPLLSVITTTDPETECLPRLINALANLAERHHWSQEIIVVDDLKQWADRDEALTFAQTHTRARTEIKTLWYPEHQGQMPALHAGIGASRGQAIVTLDPDVYVSVDAIPEMLEHWRDGYLLVHGRRTNRPDIGPIRRLGTTAINGLLRRITRIPAHDLGSPLTLFCSSIKPTLEDMPAGITNSRLYAYSLFADRLCEIPITSLPEGTRASHYRLGALIRLFFSLLTQARRVRRVTAQPPN